VQSNVDPLRPILFAMSDGDVGPYLLPRLLGNIRDSDPGSGTIHMTVLRAPTKLNGAFCVMYPSALSYVN
jgi:hypothetical protein